MRLPIRRPSGRALLGLALAALAGGVAPRHAHAQSLGLEAGMAAVENFDGSASIGATLFLPLTSRLKTAVSYAQWTGCDNNFGCDSPEGGYGNRGVNVLGLFRVLGDRGPNASLGAGVGWYEKHRLRGGASDRYWQDALTFSGELRYPVAFNSSAYLRSDLSFPTDDSQPRWGFLRLGVDVGIF